LFIVSWNLNASKCLDGECREYLIGIGSVLTGSRITGYASW